MDEEYDFSGYATRSNIPCADGRTILPDAFKDCDGVTVPLVWQHMHDSVENVLGHALLESRDGDIYCHCAFNDTKGGQTAKKVVQHGDVVGLSIYANRLRQQGQKVVHGVIREVSLVLAGANPGAYIDNLSFAHGDDVIDVSDEAIIRFVDDADEIAHSEETIEHADDSALTLFDEVLESLDDVHKQAVFTILGAISTETAEHQDENGKVVGQDSEDELEHADDLTVGDVLESLDEDKQKVAKAVIHAAIEQDGSLSKADAEAYLKFTDNEKKAIAAVVAAANNEAEHSEPEGDNVMKYNVFDAETGDEMTLSHSDMEAYTADVFQEAKRTGSLREAFNSVSLAHGIQNIEILFPEVQAVNKTPYPIMRRMEWVSTVISGARKTPFSRIKSTAANLTMEEARARGYIKGNQKIEEQISALKRITTPTTVYKLQKLDRDDIIDITDFDVVAWMKDEMRTMLDEELARAILIGDGRQVSDSSKINPLNIRPIWGDEEVYVINDVLNINGMTTEDMAKAFVDQCVRSKKNYKGSGQPTMYISPDLLVELRLLRDADGYRRYKSDSELASDLRVSKIVEVELFDNLTREVEGVERTLGAIIVNMNDYTVGATKGGEVTMFDDFDLDFNKYEYLIETRCCGALTMPYSAIVIEFAGEAVETPLYTLANTVSSAAQNPSTAGFYYFDGTEYVEASETAFNKDRIYYTKGGTGSTGAVGATGATGSTGSTGSTGAGQ